MEPHKDQEVVPKSQMKNSFGSTSYHPSVYASYINTLRKKESHILIEGLKYNQECWEIKAKKKNEVPETR